MIILDLFVAMTSGLVLVWMVFLLFGTRGPWSSLWWFFLVVSLFSWAGGIWLVPFGPQWRGRGWLPIICMGILISLLLAAASPRTSHKHRDKHEMTTAHGDTRVAIDVLVWAVIACLIFMGIGHYAWYPGVR